MKMYFVTTEGAERMDGERGYAWRLFAPNKRAAVRAAVGYHEANTASPRSVRATGCVVGGDDGLGAVNDLTGNLRRWERAEKALVWCDYISTRGGDERTGVVDLLADLMHFCASKRIDFDDALDSARMHFAAEDNGDE